MPYPTCVHKHKSKSEFLLKIKDPFLRSFVYFTQKSNREVHWWYQQMDSAVSAGLCTAVCLKDLTEDALNYLPSDSAIH